jgi:VRR-NUC domain
MTARRVAGAAADTACPAAAPAEPTETQMVAAIVDAARFTGWRVAHFRPALTRHGWRTAVQGDGAGFPDLVMVHGASALVWWVELKTSRGRLSADQEAWGLDLIRAGQIWKVVHGRAGLEGLLDDMATAPKARLL